MTTRVVVQGITGKEGAFHAARCKEHGTRVVGGERGLKPLLTDPDTGIVRAFRDALVAEGGDPQPEMMYGWGDIEFLANDHKVPALYFGPGDVKAAHTVDEYLDLDKYHLAVRVYERAIPGFLNAATARGSLA